MKKTVTTDSVNVSTVLVIFFVLSQRIKNMFLLRAVPSKRLFDMVLDTQGTKRFKDVTISECNDLIQLDSVGLQYDLVWYGCSFCLVYYYAMTCKSSPKHRLSKIIKAKETTNHQQCQIDLYRFISGVRLS